MNAVTVTQLNTYIKSIIESDKVLKRVFVVGEVSNCYQNLRSGHIYFTLKDDKTQLRCVIFSSNAARLKFAVKNGMNVICLGRVSTYDRDSSYQLYIDDIKPDGIGELSIAFEQLKSKLESEGLFDNQHKKQIPFISKKIGVATSTTGAAIEDIKNITRRRFPLTELVIAPTIVQGEYAPDDIVKSIKMLERIDDVDVIIVGRGGGSAEDLWAFNSEKVARAVYNCSKPVISAVGHETDFTICDFVADFRAETPSAAAEKATPDMYSMLEYISNMKKRITNSVINNFNNQSMHLDYICKESMNYGEYLSNKKDVIDNLTAEMNIAFNDYVSRKQLLLGALAGKLDALSPLAVLSRGYCRVNDKNNISVNSAKKLNAGDVINISFADSAAVCTVNEVEINGNDL